MSAVYLTEAAMDNGRNESSFAIARAPVRAAVSNADNSSGFTVMAGPQQMSLETLMSRAAQALASAGISVQDLLDELPAARARVVTSAYGDDLLLELERQYGGSTAPASGER